MPAYLPAGFAFHRVSYYGESQAEVKARGGAEKHMNVYFTNGSAEIKMSLLYMDEDTAFIATMTNTDMQEIKIDGHVAVVKNKSLDMLVGDVLYTFYSDDNVSMDELIKAAESLE
jgi:hypothetical protein